MSGQDATDRAPRGARPGLAAALSALIPGAGQWYTGRPVRAFVIASPLILLLVASAVAWQGGAVGILEWIVRPSVLWALLGVNALILGWRVFAVVDAYRLAGRALLNRWSLALLVVAVVIVVAPHVVAGAYGIRGALLIDRVFVSADAADVTPVTLVPLSPEADIVPDPVVAETTTTTVPPTTVPPATTTTEDLPTRNLIFRPGFGDPEAIEVRPDIVFAGPVAPFLPFDERVDAGRLTFLLAGGDAGPGRGGLRTDTIMVATIDLATGEAALFGIPRNMGQIPMPQRFKTAFANLERRLAPVSDPETWTDLDGDGVPDEPAFAPCNCFPEQINALYPYTRKWTRSFPDEVDPGMAALREVVEHMIGLQIDYYVLVDMRAFVALVEAVDGVDVYVQEPLQAEVSPPAEGEKWATVDVQPGWNHLSATEALAYARARKGSSDYARMQRQRCLLRAVAGEADALTLFRSFPAMATAIESYVVTDIPVAFLPDMVRAAATLDFSSIATVGFNPPYYAPGRDAKGHPIPDISRIRWKVAKVLEEGVVAQSSSGASECDPET